MLIKLVFFYYSSKGKIIPYRWRPLEECINLILLKFSKFCIGPVKLDQISLDILVGFDRLFCLITKLFYIMLYIAMLICHVKIALSILNFAWGVLLKRGTLNFLENFFNCAIIITLKFINC